MSISEQNKFLLSLLTIILSLFLIQTIALASEQSESSTFKQPDWFKQSFLDFQEDLDDANNSGKHIMLYFHQEGCPYCKKLLTDNFSRTDIVNRMKQNYDVLELNMWGDKTITDFSGDEYTEKEFAKKMKVMFTPTLLILNEKGSPLFRINGYYSPDKFVAVLDYIDLKTNNDTNNLPTFTEYLGTRKSTNRTAKASLHKEKFITQTEDLSSLIKNTKQAVIILFEQTYCQDCDELHGDLFRRLPIYKKLKQFTIVQIYINSNKMITTPNGLRLSQKDFAASKNVQYTPSLFFYEPSNNTAIFRSEAYLRGFHLETVLDYISSNAYKTETEFQRFVQTRADEMAEQGIKVDLWK